MQNIKTKEDGAGLGLIGGTLSLTLSTLTVKLIGLIYKIPIASILGDLGMGYFNSAYTVYSFFYLICTAGVPKAIMILCSKERAKQDSSAELKITRIGLIFFGLFGAIIFALLLLFAKPIALMIGNSGAYFTLIFIAPSILFTAPSGVLRGFLSANLRLVDIAVSGVVEGVGKLAVGLALAMLAKSHNMPLEMVSALAVFGVSIGALFGLIYLYVCSKIELRKEKMGQTISRNETGHTLLSILRISLPITLSASIMSIGGVIDLGLIMRSLLDVGYSETEASALYGNYTTLAVPMLNLVISLVAPISTAFLPIFTKAFYLKDEGAMIRAEGEALQLSAILSAPMMIGLYSFSEPILSLLFPEADCYTGGILLSALSGAIFFSSPLVIVNTFLEASGRTRAPLISTLIGSGVKLALSLILITRTPLGIFGAPIGTVAAYGVSLVFSLIFYGSLTKRPLPLIKAIAPPHIIALFSVSLSRIIYGRLCFLINDKLTLMISIALAALIYVVFSLIFGTLRPKELIKIANYTKSISEN